MSHAILRFRLPVEQCEFRIASRAMDWALAALEVDEALRGWLKYGHDFKTADEALEAVRDRLRDELEGHGVSLGDLE